jgi:hypothetical protein
MQQELEYKFAFVFVFRGEVELELVRRYRWLLDLAGRLRWPPFSTLWV